MGHDKKTSKTNAARLLDELGISYDMHEAEVDLDDLSAGRGKRKGLQDSCCKG